MNYKARLLFAAVLVFFTCPVLAEHVIIAKTGMYDMRDTVQVSSDSANIQTEYKLDDADNVFGIEYEYRTRNNISIGGEYFEFQNDYSSLQRDLVSGTSSDVGNGSLGSFVLAFNAKKYFEVTRWLFPYVGLGAGMAGGVLESPNRNDIALLGFAGQAMAGVEFRFGRFGIHAQAKAVSASIDGSDPNGGPNREFDISGTGYFAGFAVHL